MHTLSIIAAIIGLWLIASIAAAALITWVFRRDRRHSRGRRR